MRSFEDWLSAEKKTDVDTSRVDKWAEMTGNAQFGKDGDDMSARFAAHLEKKAGETDEQDGE